MDSAGFAQGGPAATHPLRKERIFCLVHDLLEQTLGSRRADRDRRARAQGRWESSVSLVRQSCESCLEEG